MARLLLELEKERVVDEQPPIPPGSMTAEQLEEEKKTKKVCHRSFFAVMVPMQVPTGAPSGLLTPGGPAAPPQMIVPSVQAGFWPCQQAQCMMWDKRKQRCLEVSAAIRQAYGKDEDL